MTNRESWDRLAARAGAANGPDGVVRYGPNGPTERDLRLLGDLKGKRVLDLGCGLGGASIAFARAGATTLALDASGEQVAEARRRAAAAEVKVEWHVGDLADLAFLRAESIDLVFSALALDEVEDLSRALRQIQRVLRAKAPFVFSILHPFAAITTRDDTDTLLPSPPTVVRSYNSPQPLVRDVDGEPIETWPRPISEIFTALARAGFRTDALHEPMPVPTGPATVLPELLVWRARKEGS